MLGMLKRRALVTATIGAIVCLLMAGFQQVVVPIGDSALTMEGYETLRHGSKFTGVLYEFHPSGGLYRVISYWKGLKQGKEIHWYANGNRWVERSFDRGVLHGESFTWFEDGLPMHFAVYRNGVFAGESWGWSRNGNVSEYRRYENGREISYKSWTVDGKPYFNYVYQDNRKVGVNGGGFCKLVNPN